MEINVKKEIKLPSPPAIAIRILEAVRDCRSTSCSLAKIVSADPALTAQVLKLANSSLYPSNAAVDSVERAVTVLGVETLKNNCLYFLNPEGKIVQATKTMEIKFQKIFSSGGQGNR
jgi:HD-like signal output (HDOD) protein